MRHGPAGAELSELIMHRLGERCRRQVERRGKHWNGFEQEN